MKHNIIIASYMRLQAGTQLGPMARPHDMRLIVSPAITHHSCCCGSEASLFMDRPRRLYLERLSGDLLQLNLLLLQHNPLRISNWLSQAAMVMIHERKPD